MKFSRGCASATVQGNVNSIMGVLFDDNLLQYYSTLGARGKKGFNVYTGVHEVVWKAVHLTYADSSTCYTQGIKDILGNIGNYLKYAPARIKSAEKAKSARKVSAQNEV